MKMEFALPLKLYGAHFQDHSHVLFLILVHANHHFDGFPRMEALVRIANIPLVETGVKTAGMFYANIKVSMTSSTVPDMNFNDLPYVLILVSSSLCLATKWIIHLEFKYR